MNINKIVNDYTKLYKAIGGLVEKSKSFCYGWKWMRGGGKEKVKDVKVEISINSEMIEQLKASQIIRILGVYINPRLE